MMERRVSTMRKFFIITLAIIIYFISSTVYQYLKLINDAIVPPTSIEQKTYHIEQEPILSKEIILMIQDDTNAEVYEQIIGEYEHKYNEIEQNILQEINELRDEIIEDMSEEMNTLTFGLKMIEYERKITNIEKRADQLFENFYSELIDTLTHKNLKTDIAEQFEKKYVSTKAKVKRDLSREANAWLNDQKEF